MITATRCHDFSYGHRVHGHESVCSRIHGHNGRVTFTVKGKLDSLGRVMDFSVIKSRLALWVEDNWDHRFLVWEKDPLSYKLQEIDFSVVVLTFNPTAEAMAEYLVNVIGPQQLRGTGVTLVSVTFEETRKCSATYTLEG